MSEPVGTFCLVLHTHLPWLAHAGAWPVGEEWLHQAFTHSWLRVVRVLEELAGEGHRDLVTLGVSPTVAAMLDDPYCLRETYTWAGFWQLRAEALAARPGLTDLATHEFRAAGRCLDDLGGRWRHGGSPVLRRLADDGVVELLGGPAGHPFQPLLDDRVVAHALRTGLDDMRLRTGRAPEGIWAPECGYRPGLEQLYAAAGVGRFLVDGPALRGDTSAAHPVAASDVLCFGRDLDVTYRVWSPRSGYPGGPDYRDFHTFDHASGFRPARVTSTRTPPALKKPWESDRADLAVARDAADFVGVVRRRLTALADRDGRPGLCVAAFDTELFGHWWYEGPSWLAAVLRMLPEAGVRVTTLRGAVEAGHVGAAVELPASSWGSGKDWRVWDGAQVTDIVRWNADVQATLLSTVDRHRAMHRSPLLDQVVREAYLMLASDWAFMVSKDSAAAYARSRIATHRERLDRLVDVLDGSAPIEVAVPVTDVDSPFRCLDARLL
ncbi:MAG: DUF1957 domain-containing protein [Geodermatophilaceae bacterium]|nr:DUF1957 domain-containing protein [Geodermatophilaceae bacterium]